MVGLIWTIQILHYPTFHYVMEDRFLKFHAFHSSRITFIVMPVMFIELISAIWLIVFFPHSQILNVNAMGVVGIWVATFFALVPLHSKLSVGKELQTLDRMVRNNWIRTLLWSVRLVLLVLFTFNFLGTHHVDIG